MTDTRIERTTLTLPVTELLDENPLPRFGEQTDKVFKDGGLRLREKKGFGQNTGYRVLPYRMQDRYAPQTTEKTIDAVVLENEYLRATFLPGYGGRLYSLWDKQANREGLYCNSEIILRNLALRDAWFSGGIEWNFGHYGHTYLTCQPVHFAACTDENGEAFLRMYEFERCKQVTFQVDFHLPRGAKALTAHMSFWNLNAERAPIFYWTNTAVPQEKGMRVFSGTAHAIAAHLKPLPALSDYRHGRLPYLYREGQDASDPSNLPFSTEYFFQNARRASKAFEAVQYQDGRMFMERSTGNMPYRKMFCWGTHAGGEHWQRFLAGKASGDYVEVQAGLARTQVHPSWIGARQTMHLTQQFAVCQASRMDGSYGEARRKAEAEVRQMLPTGALRAMHRRCTALAAKPEESVLFTGLGWGALEALRDPQALPTHLAFPQSALGAEQEPWRKLLAGEPFKACDTFMTATPWVKLMEGVPRKTAAMLLCLGTAYIERGDASAAEKALKAAFAMAEMPMAHRNMARLALRDGQTEAAIGHMKRAIASPMEPDVLRPYAEEYIALLADAKHHDDAFAYYLTLPETLRGEERMRLTVLRSAFECGEEAFVAAQFNTRFSVVREGEGLLSEVWFLSEARRRAAEAGTPVTEALVQHVRDTAALPEHLDFRMANPNAGA